MGTSYYLRCDCREDDPAEWDMGKGFDPPAFAPLVALFRGLVASEAWRALDAGIRASEYEWRIEIDGLAGWLLAHSSPPCQVYAEDCYGERFDDARRCVRCVSDGHDWHPIRFCEREQWCSRCHVHESIGAEASC